MDGIERIAAERHRQIEELGYTPEHDAHHMEGDMGYVAACLAAPSTIYLFKVENQDTAERSRGLVHWVEPWPSGWPRKQITNRADRIRELEKAGAVIAAEIDRLLAQEDEDDPTA